MNPTVLAAIALGVLVLLIVGAMVLAGRTSEDDRLTGNEVAGSTEDPEKHCASQATYDLIKRELFSRAAALRGGADPALGRVSSYSAVRMEAPMLRDENAGTGAVTCNGTLTLDLPPGVMVPSGRRSLSADILYTVQPAAGGSGSVVTIANADEIITPLATLVLATPPAGDSLNPVDPSAAVPGAEDPPPTDPLAPALPPPASSTNPSFNCANARSSGEVAVCGDAGLAALDRRMAAQFASAMADADPEQRAVLQRTRDSFLRYRDQCPSNACIAETYRGRMREIRDIMTGNWRPRR